MTKKLTNRPIRSAKVTNQPWPPPCASLRRAMAYAHFAVPSGRNGLGLRFVPVLFRQIGDQHFAHERRALRLADHEDAVDDERAIDLLVGEFEMQLIGDRQAEDVGHHRAVERRQQRGRHERAELGRIGHVGEHLHHADQRADHAEGGRAVADRAIDFLALVEMAQEIVAVALEIVADEFGVIAVGDEANALGEKRIFDLDLLQPDRALLARDLGEAGDLVDQFALR